MIIGYLLIALGVFLVYLMIDFLVITGTDLNKFSNKWVGKTLWLWLPFVGLWRLVKEVILKKK